jgi:hypothetical protein
LIGKNHCFDRPEDLDLMDVRGELWHRGLQGDAPLKGMEWTRPVEDVRAAEVVRADMPRKSPRISYAVTDFPEEDYGTSVITAQTEKYLEDQAAAADNGGDRPPPLRCGSRSRTRTSRTRRRGVTPICSLQSRWSCHRVVTMSSMRRHLSAIASCIGFSDCRTTAKTIFGAPSASTTQ